MVVRKRVEHQLIFLDGLFVVAVFEQHLRKVKMQFSIVTFIPDGIAIGGNGLLSIIDSLVAISKFHGTCPTFLLIL